MYNMNNEKYKCNDCNKLYSSYNSLWTHNKTFHKSIKTGIPIVEENPKIIIDTTTEYSCRVCNKKYKYKQGKYRHEKTCNDIKQPDREIELEKMKQYTLDKEQENIDKEVELVKLKIKLQGMKRIDDKTFKTINKLLMDRSIINNTTNNTINNNHYHFPNILSIGKENVVNTLTRGEKKYILDSRWTSIDKMVEIVHCRNHNTFKNIVITNLKDKFAYKYDETKGYFITGNKTDLLDDVLTFRMIDIETIYDELSTANKIDSKTKKLIQEFLNKMDNEEPFSYGDVEYPNYKSYKMNNIKILLYNNRDKMTKDIALLIGDDNIIIPTQEPINEIIS